METWLGSASDSSRDLSQLILVCKMRVEGSLPEEPGEWRIKRDPCREGVLGFSRDVCAPQILMCSRISTRD